MRCKVKDCTTKHSVAWFTGQGAAAVLWTDCFVYPKFASEGSIMMGIKMTNTEMMMVKSAMST
jgi:hypothetical protein